MTSAINNAMTYPIDTAKAIRRIEESGFTHKQAQAIVYTFAVADKQLAMEASIEDLRTAIENLRIEMKADIENLRIEMKAGFKRLEALIQSMKKQLLFGMALIQLSGVGLAFTLIKFFA